MNQQAITYDYRKVPVVIQAFQMTRERRWDNAIWPEWLNAAWNLDRNKAGAVYPSHFPHGIDLAGERIRINTPEGSMLVDWNDWIIRGVNGELYPCKPDIFAKTYTCEPSAATAPTDPMRDWRNNENMAGRASTLVENTTQRLNPVDVAALAEVTGQADPIIEAIDAVEAEIRAKGLTAPRITKESIEANIASETYFTAAEGQWGAEANRGQPLTVTHSSLPLLTFCVLVLRNGYVVFGHSACASPENFDADLGKKIARRVAVEKIGPLMAYELRSELTGMLVRASTFRSDADFR